MKTRRYMKILLVVSNITQSLSPNTGLYDDDGCSSFSDSRDRYGMVSGLGGRREMEDAVMAMPYFTIDMDFYDVYDGHGGDGVSNLCWDRMHVILQELVTAPDWDGYWIRALMSCFAMMNEEAVFYPDLKLASSTAVMAIVSRDGIIVDNCSNSRAVLSHDSNVIPLTVDQKGIPTSNLMRFRSQKLE